MSTSSIMTPTAGTSIHCRRTVLLGISKSMHCHTCTSADMYPRVLACTHSSVWSAGQRMHRCCAVTVMQRSRLLEPSAPHLAVSPSTSRRRSGRQPASHRQHVQLALALLAARGTRDVSTPGMGIQHTVKALQQSSRLLVGAGHQRTRRGKQLLPF
jgi:hypothetical protein